MYKHKEVSIPQEKARSLRINQSSDAPLQKKDSLSESHIRDSITFPQSLTHAGVIQLQRSIGNQAVCNLMNKAGTAHENPTPLLKTEYGGKEVEHLQNDAEVPSKPIQRKENNTGLPDILKARLENLSGLSMDGIKVHYHSDKPKQFDSLAYTKGNDIHIAPGQEKYLPHEAWHVIQQKQGRVTPTMQLKSVSVNDEEELEQEADMMGAKAAQTNFYNNSRPMDDGSKGSTSVQSAHQECNGVIQRMKHTWDGEKWERETSSSTQEDAPPPKPLPAGLIGQFPGQTYDDVTGELSVFEFENQLGTYGAEQQGKVSKIQGKEFKGPISMKDRRSEQVKRHIANLVLNRLTADIKFPEGEKPTTIKPPVEVQISSVGSRILISTNTRESEQALFSKIQESGGLKEYISDKRALRPCMDRDTARPRRYRNKLDRAFEGKRHWQTGSTEDAEDKEKAQSILDAAKDVNVGCFDPDDEDMVQAELKKIDKETAPHVYIVMHKSGTGIKDEHAERHQSDFREEHLRNFETKLSTPPTGPKTACLGCQVYHSVHHNKWQDTSGLSGAYFGGSSPIKTSEEKEKAKELIEQRPAIGSISQNGYIRNSDYPDSDTDDEGKEVLPRAIGYTVPYSDEPPKNTEWINESGNKEKIDRKSMLNKLKKWDTLETKVGKKRKRKKDTGKEPPAKKKKE